MELGNHGRITADPHPSDTYRNTQQQKQHEKVVPGPNMYRVEHQGCPTGRHPHRELHWTGIENKAYFEYTETVKQPWLFMY